MKFNVNDPSIDLKPGDIGFATIAGNVGGWVSLGQAILKDPCIFSHAYIIVRDPDDPTRCGAVEAMPKGARYVSPDVLAKRVGYSHGYVRLPLTREQREKATTEALALLGTRYSFLDYLALALSEWKIPGYRAAIGLVAKSGHLICSQLVAVVLYKIGYVLFTDLIPQQVTPGKLWWQGGASSRFDRPLWWPPHGPSVNKAFDNLPSIDNLPSTDNLPSLDIPPPRG